MLHNNNFVIFEEDTQTLALAEKEHEEFSRNWLELNSMFFTNPQPDVPAQAPHQNIVVPVPDPVEEEAKPDESELLALAKRYAWRDAKKYFLVYAIADGSFQASEDAIIAKINGKFSFEADPSFSPQEILLAFQMYGIGYSLYHLVLDTLLRYQEGSIKSLEDVWEIITDAAKFGLQFFGFYLFDKPFPIDWESAEETLPNIFLVCFAMSILCYLMDVVPSLAWSYCRGKNADDRIHILKTNLGAAIGVGIGTAGWLIPYYFPLQEKIGLPGYIIKRDLEGAVANLVALPFVYQSALVERKEQAKQGELALEDEVEEKQRVSVCTRASNYFKNWMFKKKDDRLLDFRQNLIQSDSMELVATPSHRQSNS